MKTEFKNSFIRAIKKINDQQLKEEIANAIRNVESAENLKLVRQLKKLKGYKQYYRIRIGNYRIGIMVDVETVFFVEIDHRRDIYRNFP